MDSRELAKIEKGRVYLNEDELNIYSYPTDKIDGWKPALDLPPFAETSKIYLDIETYSNNSMVLDAFIISLKRGTLDPKKDFNVVKHITKKLESYQEFSPYPHQVSEEISYLQHRLKTDCEHFGKIDGDGLKFLNSIVEFVQDNYREFANQIEDIDPQGALHSDRAKIVLIGLMNEKGEHIIIDCVKRGEAEGIKMFFKILEKKNPQFLLHFNGFSFDIPFIVGRCDILGISHPLWRSDTLTVFRTAQAFNKPTEYYAYWLNRGETAIIDLYHQALAWDFVNRKLTKFSLKEVPIQLGLRKDRRLTLSYAEMKKSIEAGNMSALKEYLVYDLEDSKLIGDLLLPDIYYQKQILPHWNYQSLSTGGMGTKWNDVLLTEYKKLDYNFTPPKPDSVLKFQGGLVGGRAGLYRYVVKGDFQSMYPNIMENYQVHSIKDTRRLILSILRYLKLERIRLKKIAAEKKGTPEGTLAQQRQGALKVMINSAYGALGVMFKEFNDYIAAAFVTAYGRALLKRFIALCIDAGGIPASYDTDGLYFASDDPTFETQKAIFQHIQDNLPPGFVIEYELEALCFYVPPSTDKDLIEEGEGMRKSYIIISKNKKTGEIETKANGKFRKRDKSELERSFTPGLVRAYLDNEHEKYYQNILCQLLTKTYPTENLSITRKIKSTEVKIVKQGIGKHNEVVTIFKAPDKRLIGKKGKYLKAVEPVWSLSPLDIDWMYYVSMIKTMYQDFLNVPKH